MMPSIPIELILHIVGQLLPSNPDEILPPSHPTTRTLLALTQTSRFLSPIASDLLWRHCTKISSPEKARQFAAALASLSPDDARRPRSLFLGLYQGKEGTDREFPWPETVPDSAPVDMALTVKDILLGVSPTLQRLILHMPLRGSGQHLDTLRPAFESLVHLEEFVSINDSFSFRASHPDQPEVWASSWPKLRRLSLDNPVINFSPMSRLPKLDTVVIPRKFAFQLLMTGNIKGNLTRALNTERKTPSDEPFTMTFIDHFGSRWTDLSPNNQVRVLLIDVGHSLGIPRPREPTQLSQIWVKQNALKGLLWNAARSGNGDWFGCTNTSAQ